MEGSARERVGDARSAAALVGAGHARRAGARETPAPDPAVAKDDDDPCRRSRGPPDEAAPRSMRAATYDPSAPCGLADLGSESTPRRRRQRALTAPRSRGPAGP